MIIVLLCLTISLIPGGGPFLGASVPWIPRILINCSPLASASSLCALKSLYSCFQNLWLPRLWADKNRSLQTEQIYHWGTLSSFITLEYHNSRVLSIVTATTFSKHFLLTIEWFLFYIGQLNKWYNVLTSFFMAARN